MEQHQTESIADTIEIFLASLASSSKGTSVLFENLSVEGSGRGVQPAPTVSTTFSSWLNMLSPSFYTQPKPSRPLLQSFSGTLALGEMLLVVGKPGSGCTTFLKTLANMREEYKDTTGILKYGGVEASHVSSGFPRITFCAEEESHLPTLTVAETLRFAVRSTWNSNATADSIDTAVKTLAQCFGLSRVLNTKVGNEAIRGVSGGERQRVSLAEAVATCPDVLCLDNPTNGLDSSTALEFIETMREFTRQRGCATAMSVYQGSNAMVPMFDKILVIHSGREIYYGKASEAKTYFEDLGFICPERTTITDFLNSMTAEPQLRHVREGMEYKVPRTASEFQEAFQSSLQYKTVVEEISAQTSTENPDRVPTPVYALPIYRQVAECAVRQIRVLIRDYHTWAIEAACIIVQSVLLGTIFRNQPRETRSFFMLASSMFYSVLVPSLQSMSEFSNTFAQRSLVIRQKRYRFYRPLSYALGLVVTDAIWKIIAISYNIPQYFLTGFQKSGGKFFTWFFVVYIEHMALSMFFRAVAVFSPSAGRAVLPVGIFFNILVLYTGLYLPAAQAQGWLRWVRYINPMNYAYESVMANEFGNSEYQCSPADLAPYGPGLSIENQVCAVPGSSWGQAFVSGKSFIQAQYSFEVSHLWRNVGINVGFFVALALLTAIGMERYRLPAGRLATIFYNAKRQDFTLPKKTAGSDSEIGPLSEEDVPPATGTVLEKQASYRVTAHDGRTLAWKNVSLEINTKDGKRRLLDSLNGIVKPGQLTALMGMSGAGKTTLLNVLAGRMESGALSGDLLLDGERLPKAFRRFMGYVQQQDVHLPTQTVREALQMTARLRRSGNISLTEKDAYVEEVIKVLEMEDIADALVGVPGAGMNLEQRKRVTIGVELSARPEILFLDEPTSGLDGQSAVKIVRLLKKLAASGQTVLCTIHQPAAEVIETFDSLVLLIRGGKLAYQGLFGNQCSGPLAYFARHARSCGPDENPAEYLLDIVGAGSRSESKTDWSEIWVNSPENKSLQEDLNRLTSGPCPNRKNIDQERTYATPLHFQLLTVLKRAWLYYWREPDYFTSKLLMNLFNALVNGLSYLNSRNNQQGAYNLVFSIFMSIIVGPPVGLMAESRFISLRDIFFLREKASLTYNWLAFVLSAIIVELPYAFVTSLVYWLLWYFPVGYSFESSRAGYNFLMYELFSVFAHSLAQLCASIMPNLGATFMANGFFFMFVNTFAGTLTPRPTTPSGWSWYYYVSPLFYFGEGTVANALHDLEISCDVNEASVFQPPGGQTCVQFAGEFLQNATGYLLNPKATEGCQYCRYRDGQSYYAQYGYDFAHRYRNIGIFTGFIAFNYTAVIILTYLIKVKTWKRR